MKTIILAIAAISSNLGVELNPKQTECLSTVIYHEARGEPIMGQVAVAHVVLNRVKSSRYPNTICEVVYQPWQFSHIERARPDYNSDAWKRAVKIATHTQAGLVEDETNGATMYYSHAVMNEPPKWDFSKLSYVGKLQGHSFYSEI